MQAVEEIKETVEVEAGITLNASRTEYVSGSGARESSSRRPCRRHRKQTHPRSSRTRRSPDCTEAAGSVTAGVKPASEAGRGMTAASAQAAATAAPPAAEPLRRRRRGNDGRGACQKSTAGSQKSRFPQRWKKIRRLRGGCLMGIREASFISGKQFRKGWTKWRRDR